MPQVVASNVNVSGATVAELSSLEATITVTLPVGSVDSFTS